ncbi:DNA-directed RNA polymerase sigma-70 factor [Acrocarpospora pleiomorpha]|uniref:DNA-directed RNA polymerase sigma-70 factor n=1 Tax=Acrocarpospora pleiomorpha TaxID=90975 RepID=A0A5M3XD44_9ACTN|nr:SigE family RNA polymerase sigma factor [Acrocarpospora pleiomorpha]GES19565.1 DNA-directed RNA polymerase sigma-70 factor [Acrocarpospora pleiomorpha]
MNPERARLPMAEGGELGADHDAVAFLRVGVVGDRDEQFAAFVDAAGPYLLHTAELLCGDKARAQDLVQATFERTYRSWSKARDGDPRAYARRILVNLRIDGWRRTRRELLSAPGELPDPTTPDHAAAVTARGTVVHALARLPVTQRRVVVLRHLLDLTEPEVARELGISVGTVKSHNARALTRLREILSEGDRS